MVEDEKQLHRNFITWEDVPPVHHEFWFDRMEASLSKAALVKVWKLSKSVKIQFCKQLLEFTTGLKPQQKVGDVKSIRAIGDAFVKDNLSRGRPARDLNFLVEWERDGHFAVLCALRRWVMTVRPWGFQAVLDMGELREGVQLTVDMNWSLEDATLMIKGQVCKTVRCNGEQALAPGTSSCRMMSREWTPMISRSFSLCRVPFRRMPVACRSPNELQLTLAPSPGKFSTRSDDMPSLLGLTTLATAAPSKKPASEVGLEEERTPKRPRAGELAEK